MRRAAQASTVRWRLRLPHFGTALGVSLGAAVLVGFGGYGLASNRGGEDGSVGGYGGGPESAPTPAATLAALDSADADVPVGADSPEPVTLLPGGLLQLPESVDSAVVVDVEEYRLYRFERRGAELLPAENFYVAIGKQGADKRREGDERTPVGLYFVSSFIPGDELPPIYGVGAYPIDYPSAWDRFLGRTGSGIWIHGTNKADTELLPRSSRGCLTLRNSDFTSLGRSVEIGSTPVLVTQSIRWRTPREMEQVRHRIASRVERWRQDWESLRTDDYLEHYHPEFRSGNMDLARWSAHKRRVNAKKTEIRVELEDLGIFQYPGEEDLYVVTFHQAYRSNNFNSERRKQQYWRRGPDGDFRILLEAGG